MVTGPQLSLSLLLIIGVFYGIHFWLIRMYDRFRKKGSSTAVDYTILALIFCLLLILQPVILPGIGFYTDQNWGMTLQIIGLLVYFGSLLLYWWARSNLQEFFGERIEVQKGQYLVKTGPYAFIRHPIYTSFFLFGFGLLLINPSIPVILLLVYTFWDYGRAVIKEEKFLSDEIPGYQDYISRTSRFFPFPQQFQNGRIGTLDAGGVLRDAAG